MSNVLVNNLTAIMTIVIFVITLIVNANIIIIVLIIIKNLWSKLFEADGIGEWFAARLKSEECVNVTFGS